MTAEIGRMWNVDDGRIGIELPPLNTVLVEVYCELAMVQNGTKDMVTKNKRRKKQEKYAQGQLAEAQRRITELEEQLRAQPMGPHPIAATPPQDEVHHLVTSLAKAQKTAEIAEMEVGCLRDEFQQ